MPNKKIPSTREVAMATFSDAAVAINKFNPGDMLEAVEDQLYKAARDMIRVYRENKNEKSIEFYMRFRLHEQLTRLHELITESVDLCYEIGNTSNGIPS